MTAPPQVVIRDIESHDLAPILYLTGLIPEAPAWSTEDFRKLISPSPETDSTLVRVARVAESNHQVLGLVVVQCLRLPHDDTQTSECELESILVHPASRRSGIGQRLLVAAMQWCTEQQATLLRLEVRESNAAAIGLYQKHGFMRAGKRPHYYAHPDEDALLLQRSL